MKDLLVSAASACISYLLLYVLIPILRSSLLDQPTARSSHKVPTPTGGGIVFVVVVLVASALSARQSGFAGLVTVPFMILPLSIVGFLDDCYNLSPYFRFSVQLITTALIVVPFGFPWFIWPFLFLSITTVINFVNFMDGLDGLVAGCMAILLCTASLLFSVPWPIFSLIGALIGFLVWNWSPAAVFMGDVGSTFLGAMLASVLLHAPRWPEAMGLILVATPLLGDALFCLLRRLFTGQPIWQAHRLHLFQRLHQAGWTPGCVSGLYISSTALLAVALIFAGWFAVIPLSFAVLLLGVWLDQRVALPFSAVPKA